MNILIIEDEQPINHVIKAYMKKVGFTTFQAFNGKEGYNLFKKEQIDFILLDIMMPELDGISLLKKIRTTSNVPVIMLTALNDQQHILESFEHGADDYISKPFTGEEVIARTKAVIRRTNSGKLPDDSIQFGQLMINPAYHTVRITHKELNLAPRDFSVLLFLAEHPNQIFSRDQLLDHIWGFDYEGSDRAVDLAIKRLRKALSSWPEHEGQIETVRGHGYLLKVEDRLL